MDSALQIAGALSVPVFSALVSLGGVWLARTWLFARLSESIKHEYATALQQHKRVQDQELQDHKGLLETKLQVIRHENEVGQLRTSLFFDHQREAFQAILNETATAIELWWQQYDLETCLVGPVPEECYRAVQVLIRKNQLFLDSDCTLALDILMKVYRRSMPFDDGGGGPPYMPDGRKQIDDAEYLQPRIASVFQMKIGVPHTENAFADIALFGVVRFLQSYRLGQGEPWSEHLVLDALDAEDAVAFAREHLSEMLGYLNTLLGTLREEGWMSNARYTQLKRLVKAIQ